MEHEKRTKRSFRIDNTDHIFDVNKNESQDQVDLVCPQQPPSLPSAANGLASKSSSSGASNGSLSQQQQQEQQHYVIYSVTKEEYDTCRLASAGSQAQTVAKTVAKCDQQQANRPFTVTFRNFSPQPGGLEFKSGQDYYFITALLDQDPVRRFSPCRDQNMKVIFRVCCSKPAPSPAASQPLSSLLQRPAAAAGGASTRRPGAMVAPSLVITLRPSLVHPSAGSKQHQKFPILSGQQQSDSQQQQQQQLMPVTVLPIEELHEPSSSESPEILVSNEGLPSSSTAASSLNGNNNQDQTRNDIVQNEQASPATVNFPGPPAAPPTQLGGYPRPEPQQPPLLIEFDPSKSPQILMQRYTPTPLPKIGPKPRGSLQQPQQHHTREPHHAPLGAEPAATRPAPASAWPPQQQHHSSRLHTSRLDLYPSHNQAAAHLQLTQPHDGKQVSPPVSFILPPQNSDANNSGSQGSGLGVAGSGPALATLLLLPGLLLVALVLRLHRRWRRHDSRARMAAAAAEADRRYPPAQRVILRHPH